MVIFFNHDLLVLFPKEVLLKYAVIPLESDGNMITFVTNNPDNTEMQTELAEYTSSEIYFSVGIYQNILDAVEEYYDESLFSSNGDIDPADEEYEDDELISDISEL